MLFDNLLKFDDTSSEAKNIIDEINNKQNKLQKKEEQIYDLKYEARLIAEDIVNTIKIDIYRSTYNLFRTITPNIFWGCWRYSNDKESAKDYKESFDTIINMIEKNILKNNTNFKLYKIYDYNYGTYYEFEFTYIDTKLRIDIPMYNNASINNYKELLAGYRLYLNTSENSSTKIYQSIDFRELADFLEKYVQSLDTNHERCM